MLKCPKAYPSAETTFIVICNGGVAMATQQITLDKFGSETSPVQEKVYRRRRCFILLCLPQPGSNRITDFR